MRPCCRCPSCRIALWPWQLWEVLRERPGGCTLQVWCICRGPKGQCQGKGPGQAQLSNEPRQRRSRQAMGQTEGPSGWSLCVWGVCWGPKGSSQGNGPGRMPMESALCVWSICWGPRARPRAHDLRATARASLRTPEGFRRVSQRPGSLRESLGPRQQALLRRRRPSAASASSGASRKRSGRSGHLRQALGTDAKPAGASGGPRSRNVSVSPEASVETRVSPETVARNPLPAAPEAET